MGCCSSNAAVTKHADDRTIDEVSMEDTKVEDFNSTCDSIGDLINMIATTNNNMVDSVDRVKAIGTLLLGGYTVKVELDKNEPKLEFMKDEGEDEPTKVPFSKVPNASPELNAAKTEIEEIISKYNEAVAGKSCTVVVKGSRLVMSECAGVSPQDKGDIMTALASFNNTLFVIRMELMKSSLKDTLDLKKAIKDCIAEMKKIAENLKPKLEVNMEGLKEGNLEVSLDLGINTDNLFGKPQKIYKALLSEDEEEMGLIPILKSTAEELPTIQEKLKTVQEEVDGLPKDMDGFKEKAEGLGPMEIPGAFKALGTNTGALADVPTMIKDLTDNIQAYLTELKEAVEGMQ